ncbi:MAG: hypothetical protein HOH19_09485 [Kordiimonadaceae bacterium]|jgi:hypothetical protein|nr:hypothetical protein [Kordiimonadaceae bacterium]MBT6032795.1 hypothetical protein [Kordiimonadaceae bacterium]
MKNNIKYIAKKILGDNRGAFAVEYALLLPLFTTLTLGSMEMGRILMVYASLEGAVTEATRISITGNIPDGYSTIDEYIRAYVEENLEVIGVDDGVTISMNVYDSFSDIGNPEPFTDEDGDQTYDVGECYTDINSNNSWDTDMGATGTGGEENIMVMELSVDLPYLMPTYISGMIGAGEYLPLSTSTAVRNEPFGGVSWEPSDNIICS